MRLLLDQDIYAVTRKFLIEAGHDVAIAAELQLSQAPDEEILKVAEEQNRILVTRDRDYGNLVFVKGIKTGAIYLRILPNNINTIHSHLKSILQTYSQEELGRAFVVVEPSGHRFRKLSP